MISFIGDYTVKLDAKGRLTFPSAFKKRMGEAVSQGLVVKRDVYVKCLVLYPKEEWDREVERIRARTNPYNKKQAQTLRQFFAGTFELTLDSNNRILIPKLLLDYAEAGEDLVLAGQAGKIEVWDLRKYEESCMPGDSYGSDIEELLGGPDEPAPGR
ncbi:MAG: protein mraZ [Bacteroidales bacterium]